MNDLEFKQVANSLIESGVKEKDLLLVLNELPAHNYDAITFSKAKERLKVSYEIFHTQSYNEQQEMIRLSRYLNSDPQKSFCELINS